MARLFTFLFVSFILHSLALDAWPRHVRLIENNAPYASPGQEDTTVVANRPRSTDERLNWLVRDSARFARELEKQRVKDSIENARDSLLFLYLKPLPPNSPNLFLDSLVNEYTVTDGDLLAYARKFVGQKDQFYQKGELRKQRSNWVLLSLGVLLLLFGCISVFFRVELIAIIHAFYSDRTLAQLSKEDNFFTSWAFLFLYVLFGFTVGIFIYIVLDSMALHTSYTGMHLFFILSLLVVLLFTAKIVITRILGFVFDLQRLVRDYISALYLCYFNVAIVLLPLVMIMLLLSSEATTAGLWAALIVIGMVLAFQFLRVSKNVLTSYQFPKFYLFLYLCTLEIGPILILLKLLVI